MRTRYYEEDDVAVLTERRAHRSSGGILRDDFDVILTYASEGSEEVTQIDIFGVSRFLPLSAERGYDADTDTLTLGDKPTADYRVVDDGPFVSYRQWFDDGSEWDVVALDIRQASKHMAKVADAMPQQAAMAGE